MHALATPVFEADVLDEHVRDLAGDLPIAAFTLRSLNGLLGGVFPGRMTTLGATPGAGKTTLMQMMAEDLATQGLPVIFVSTELPAPKLLAKSLARLSNGRLEVGDVAAAADPGSEKHGVFADALELYRERVAPNLCIMTEYNLASITRAIGSCADERGKTPVLFVDYLQLAATSGADPFVDERLAIAACVKGLRDLSNCCRAPIFAISTITRSDYGKKSPNLSIFGGTAAIEYSFDSALLLTEDPNPGPSRNARFGDRPMLLTALKNRYGSLGDATLGFDCAHATFREWE